MRKISNYWNDIVDGDNAEKLKRFFFMLSGFDVEGCDGAKSIYNPMYHINKFLYGNQFSDPVAYTLRQEAAYSNDSQFDVMKFGGAQVFEAPANV